MKLALVFASIVAVSSVAHADNKQKAEALFKQGKKLMGESRYADACNAFEESYKLDPGIGAQLNVAKCYEEWGKLARAFTAYQLAEKLSKDENDARTPKIHAIVEQLDSQVPRLNVKLPKDAPKGLVVTIDAKPLTTFGESFVIDPGPHTIEYGIGDQKKQKIVPMDRGADSEITLEITKGMYAAAKPGGGGKGAGEGEGDDKKPPPKVASKPAPGRNMRIGGIALGGAGVLAIGVSSVMTLSARSKYNDALDKYCGGMTNGCDAMGLDITHDARHSANVATVVFLVGTAAVGGGVALYLLAPKGAAKSEESDAEARYLVPTITPDGAGIVYGGRY
jgi:tetratricopeptide (TPR) repeat protein